MSHGEPAARSTVVPAATDHERRQALIDLEKRAFPGAFVFATLWLLMAWTTGVAAAEPLFAALASGVLLAFAISRCVLHRGFAARVERNERRARVAIYALLFVNTTLFSLLGVAARFWAPLAPVEAALIIVSGVACAAGTMTLGFDRMVRLALPAGGLVPYFIGMLFAPNATELGGVLVFATYLMKATRHVHDDYWNAVHARTLLEQRAVELEALGDTDALTRIPNRRHFERRLAEEWAGAARRGETLSLLMLDIDHFKQVNDSFGHPFGDRCLLAVAAAMRTGLPRRMDVLARYGGEEFVVLLPATDAAAARTVAERLRREVAALIVEEGAVRVALTCSIGSATLAPGSTAGGPASVVALADHALYEAKAAGRDRVVASAAARHGVSRRA